MEQFIRRNLGKEVFERLVEPFCSGVYAGDPSKLSMTAAFGKVLTFCLTICYQTSLKHILTCLPVCISPPQLLPGCLPNDHLYNLAFLFAGMTAD